MIIILFALFTIFLLGGMEIAIALGVASVGAVLLGSNILDPMIVPQRIISIVTRSWPLLTIPMFIMLGEVFIRGGISDRVVKASGLIIGRIYGGLAMVNIIASFFFGGVSGSAVADTTAIGGVLIPAMVKKGYDSPFSTVVTITSSTLGPIVPPSIVMIIFGWVTNLSIGGLFVTGYPVGVLLTIGLLIITYIYSRKRKYPRFEKISLKEAFNILLDSFPALVTPLLIVGGIVFGVVTIVEASVVALVYAVLISFLYYKELKISDFKDILRNTVTTTSSVGILVAFSSGFAWLITYARLPYHVAEYISKTNIGPIPYLLLIVFIYLILGCFLNPGAIIIMTTPVLYPIALTMGINPYHYALVSLLSLQIGNVTPPVGQCLFVGCSISGDSIESLLPLLIPYIGVMLLVVIFIILFPELIIWAPRIFGY